MWVGWTEYLANINNLLYEILGSKQITLYFPFVYDREFTKQTQIYLTLIYSLQFEDYLYFARERLRNKDINFQSHTCNYVTKGTYPVFLLTWDVSHYTRDGILSCHCFMTHVCPMKENVKGKALQWHSFPSSDLIHIKILHAPGRRSQTQFCSVATNRELGRNAKAWSYPFSTESENARALKSAC